MKRNFVVAEPGGSCLTESLNTAFVSNGILELIREISSQP